MQFLDCANILVLLRVQALKVLLAVTKHFADFEEDQFDFHSYCVRKMTLRAYVAMLRMEDTLHANIFYSRVGPPWAVQCGCVFCQAADL